MLTAATELAATELAASEVGDNTVSEYSSLRHGSRRTLLFSIARTPPLVGGTEARSRLAWISTRGAFTTCSVPSSPGRFLGTGGVSINSVLTRCSLRGVFGATGVETPAANSLSKSQSSNKSPMAGRTTVEGLG